jgi:DNA-binding transcriptional MerR regulator
MKDYEHIEKLYFTIGEVAREFGVYSCTIRFWQEEFGFESRRNRHGNRVFTREQIEAVREIHRLIRIEGYTIPGAKRQLSLRKEALPSLSDRVDLEEAHLIGGSY